MESIIVVCESGRSIRLSLDALVTRNPNNKGEQVTGPEDGVSAAFPSWPAGTVTFVVQHEDGQIEEVDSSRAPNGRVIGWMPIGAVDLVILDAVGEMLVASRQALSAPAIRSRRLSSVIPVDLAAGAMSLFTGLDCGTAFRTALPRSDGRWRKLGPGKGAQLQWAYVVPAPKDDDEGALVGGLRYFGSATNFVVGVGSAGQGIRLVPSCARLQGARVRGSRHGLPQGAVFAQASLEHDLVIVTRNGRVLRVAHEFGEAYRRKLIDLEPGDRPIAMLAVPLGQRTSARRPSRREAAAKLRKSISARCGELDLDSLAIVAALCEALPGLGSSERERLSEILQS